MSSFKYHSVCGDCGCENNLNILYVYVNEICKLWNIVYNCESESGNENLRVTCFFFSFGVAQRPKKFPTIAIYNQIKVTHVCVIIKFCRFF